VSGTRALPAGYVLSRVGAHADRAPHDARNSPLESPLELRREGEREGRGVRCDLGAFSLRGGVAEARSMPVVKAVGDAVTVVDATAGLLGDAFVLAVAGYQVTALERSLPIYELASDGLERAMRDPRLAELLGGRLRVVFCDAKEWLTACVGTDAAPDAILIDPMFPPKRRASALPRKEMVMLREVVGADLDATELLGVALRCARKRVALKRGDDAIELAKPDWSIEGKTVRFDVWRSQPS